jgi:hypothetical protein
MFDARNLPFSVSRLITPAPDTSGLILATSNAGFCAVVCDVAGIAAMTDMSNKAKTGFILFSTEGVLPV